MDSQVCPCILRQGWQYILPQGHTPAPACTLCPFLWTLRSFLIILPGTNSSNILRGTLHGAENTRTCHGNSHQSSGTCSYDATVEKGRERNHYVYRDDMRQREALFTLCCVMPYSHPREMHGLTLLLQQVDGDGLCVAIWGEAELSGGFLC